jgi:hypothetical protein
VAKHTQEFTPESVLINLTPKSGFTTLRAWFFVILWYNCFYFVFCPDYMSRASPLFWFF